MANSYVGETMNHIWIIIFALVGVLFIGFILLAIKESKELGTNKK